MLVLLGVEKGSEARGECGIKGGYCIPPPMNEVCDLNGKKIIVYMNALLFLIQREDC